MRVKEIVCGGVTMFRESVVAPWSETAACRRREHRWNARRAAGRPAATGAGRGRRSLEQRRRRGQGSDKSPPHASDPTYGKDPGWTVFHLPSTPDGISIPDHPGRSGARFRRRLAGAPEAQSDHAVSASTAPSWGILLRSRRRPSGTVWLAGAWCRRAGNMLARLLPLRLELVAFGQTRRASSSDVLSTAIVPCRTCCAERASPIRRPWLRCWSWHRKTAPRTTSGDVRQGTLAISFARRLDEGPPHPGWLPHRRSLPGESPLHGRGRPRRRAASRTAHVSNTIHPRSSVSRRPAAHTQEPKNPARI
jgi:hypothetical protein